MATHSSILVWRIPWAEEPGRLQSVGLQRVRHDLATKERKRECRDGMCVCVFVLVCSEILFLQCETMSGTRFEFR